MYNHTILLFLLNHKGGTHVTLIHLAILFPIIAAVIVGLSKKYSKRIHTGWLVLPVPLLIVIYFLTLIPDVSRHDVLYHSMNVMPYIGLNFDVYVDGLGLLFAILISGIGALVVLYSIGYLSHREDLTSFYIYLLIFMTAMLGVVLNDNVLGLYLFWELTSISSFLLIAFWYNRERSLYGATKSMLITMGGGFLMLGGFLSLYLITGSFSIREMIAQVDLIQASELAPIAIVLILLGAFTKSAQFPFYIWLPDAMEAPTPVSAYLHSATMVKAGLYLVARFTPIFAFSELWVWLILLTGLITLAWASFNAVKQDDLKAMLAFSTVSQLGMIMSLLGLGALGVHTGAAEGLFTVAIVAAVFHLINHATFKGALFMLVGIIDHESGTRSLKRLGGLMTIMPITGTMTAITAASMAGLPPFNGFLSKEMFLEVMVNIRHADFSFLSDVSILFPILAVFGSIFTFIYSIMLFKEVFLGKETEVTPKTPHEASWLMLTSPMILSLLVIVFGLFPNILSQTIIDPAAMGILGTTTEPDTHIYHWHGFDSPALWLTVFIIVSGTLLYMTRHHWMFIYEYHKEHFTLNYLYDRGLVYSRISSKTLNDKFVNGNVSHYLAYVLGFFVVISIYTFIVNGMAIDIRTASPITLQEMVVVSIILIALAGIMVVKSRIVAIILLGAIGYAMALLFVIFRSADLGLTQLSIETVTTTIFLLVFSKLPDKESYKYSVKLNIPHLIISIGVALCVIIIGYSAYSNRLFESISQFHIDNVYDLAAGGNMVNVILVDFRGFDTLFETLVFAIAGLGIYSMMRLRLNTKKEGDDHEERIDESGL